MPIVVHRTGGARNAQKKITETEGKGGNFLSVIPEPLETLRISRGKSREQPKYQPLYRASKGKKKLIDSVRDPRLAGLWKAMSRGETSASDRGRPRSSRSEWGGLHKDISMKKEKRRRRIRFVL